MTTEHESSGKSEKFVKIPTGDMFLCYSWKMCQPVGVLLFCFVNCVKNEYTEFDFTVNEW